MAIARRVVLFLILNAAVMLTSMLAFGLICYFLGIDPYYINESYGINYVSLAVFCGVWGFGGAFISLFLSKKMAKWTMGVQIIDPDTRDPQAQEIVQMVHRLSQAAGLPKMPEVGIYESPELNAFATGPSRSNSLVAISTGLWQKMSRDEVEGVIGHEVAHIANGDMVTMTLLQGVVNAFVMFLARVAAFAVEQALRGRDENGAGLGFFARMMLIWVFEALFMVIGSMVVAWFSRFREYRADAGGARLAGRDKMVSALEKLRQTYEIRDPRQEQATGAFQSMKISGWRKGGLAALFSTHPPLEQRIQRLETATHL